MLERYSQKTIAKYREQKKKDWQIQRETLLLQKQKTPAKQAFNNLIERLKTIEPLLTMSIKKESSLTEFLATDDEARIKVEELSIALEFAIRQSGSTNFNHFLKAFQNMKQTSGYSVLSLLKDDRNWRIYEFFKEHIETLEIIYLRLVNTQPESSEVYSFPGQASKAITPIFLTKQLQMPNTQSRRVFSAATMISQLILVLPLLQMQWSYNVKLSCFFEQDNKKFLELEGILGDLEDLLKKDMQVEILYKIALVQIEQGNTGFMDAFLINNTIIRDFFQERLPTLQTIFFASELYKKKEDARESLNLLGLSIQDNQDTQISKLPQQDNQEDNQDTQISKLPKKR